jgi:hypothetical protein
MRRSLTVLHDRIEAAERPRRPNEMAPHARGL